MILGLLYLQWTALSPMDMPSFCYMYVSIATLDPRSRRRVRLVSNGMHVQGHGNAGSTHE